MQSTVLFCISLLLVSIAIVGARNRRRRPVNFVTCAVQVFAIYVAIEVILFVLMFGGFCAIGQSNSGVESRVPANVLFRPILRGTCDSSCLSGLIEDKTPGVVVFMDSSRIDEVPGWVPSGVSPGLYTLSLDESGGERCASMESYDFERIRANDFSFRELTDLLKSSGQCIVATPTDASAQVTLDYVFKDSRQTFLGVVQGFHYLISDIGRARGGDEGVTLLQSSYKIYPTLPAISAFLAFFGVNESSCASTPLIFPHQLRNDRNSVTSQ